MRNLVTKYCDRCQTELPLGTTKYNVRVEITADWDGYLPDIGGDEEARRQILEHASRLDEKTLEDQVHMEIELVLCPECRELFIDDVELAGDGRPMRKTKPPINLQ